MKILFFAGHLSTGGSPAYLIWLINKYKDKHIIKVVEYCNYSERYVIHKEKIVSLVGSENFLTVFNYWEECSDSDVDRFIRFTEGYQPDEIHLNELPEIFALKPLHPRIIDFLYNPNRNFRIIETCHTSEFDFKNKKHIPDSFAFCSDKHLEMSKHIDVPKTVIEMELEQRVKPDRNKILESLGLDNKTLHILNVGLFNEFKNQKYVFQIANQLLDYDVKFHFIGNLCFINNCDIGDLLNLPNCKIWGERDDVDKFMSCMDLFVFPSLKELNPIVLKEAIGWRMPCFVNKLPIYGNKYDNQVWYIDNNNVIDYIKSKSKKTIKFGIYTSFYNSNKYIGRIYDNILKQTYTNWEWYITDDFSSDDTCQKLKEIIKHDKRIKYVKQKRKKEMYWQPNKFIKNDYIVLVDADDEFDIDFLWIYFDYVKKYPEAVILTSDFRKKKEDGSLHSISYIVNNEHLKGKITKYHPNVDYNNNLSYYAFGTLRCFKNIKNLTFNVNKYEACAEDSYRMMFLSKYGRWLHIPRVLYIWNLYKESESHGQVNYSTFNDNFDIGLKNCQESEFEPFYVFNDIYKEANSFMFLDRLPITISIISKELNNDQKQKISNLYFNRNIRFNITFDCQLYVIIVNYFDNDLDYILNKIKSENIKCGICLYYLDENIHENDKSKDEFLVQKFAYIKDRLNNHFSSYRYFSYIRHLSFIVDYAD